MKDERSKDKETKQRDKITRRYVKAPKRGKRRESNRIEYQDRESWNAPLPPIKIADNHSLLKGHLKKRKKRGKGNSPPPPSAKRLHW